MRVRRADGAPLASDCTVRMKLWKHDGVRPLDDSAPPLGSWLCSSLGAAGGADAGLYCLPARLDKELAEYEGQLFVQFEAESGRYGEAEYMHTSGVKLPKMLWWYRPLDASGAQRPLWRGDSLDELPPADDALPPPEVIELWLLPQVEVQL